MQATEDSGMAIRRAGPDALGAALRASRDDTLATFAACEAALPGLTVPQHDDLNPPLWELGHVGWFQEVWLARNPGRAAGARANPQLARFAPLRPGADALYDSGMVAHDSRWSLPLPDAAATRADLGLQLERTLALLDDTPDDDNALYFFRLALLHEDMHHEAALYMAQALGLPQPDPRWQPQPLPEANAGLHFGAGDWVLGHDGAGFAFDNELQPVVQRLVELQIDSRPVRWTEFLPFVDAGGYDDARWWSTAGRGWRAGQPAALPRYVQRHGGGWQQLRHGRWCVLDLSHAACHLSAFEAEAWCAWAGRRLPTEAEWERAAVQQPSDFHWGEVWEWTASDFNAYPGFVAHPYRDYSAPWFGSRRVLRGASFMTQARMRHPRYRNYFAPARSDLAAGFRSCVSA